MLALGVAAPVAALAAWVVLTPALFPGTLLAAASGLTFGAIWGTAIAWGGAVLGGLAAFTFGAHAPRAGPALRLVRRSTALSRAHAQLERRGFAAVLAARLVPASRRPGCARRGPASPR